VRHRMAIRVESAEDEDELMGHCVCGASWRLASESVDPVAGRWLDSVGVRCSACGVRSVFTFDITPFFEPRPAVWARRSSVAVPISGTAFANAA
jgi:hypothetical protein